jgi:hypothetical protein
MHACIQNQRVQKVWRGWCKSESQVRNEPDNMRIIPIIIVPSAPDFAATFLEKKIHEGIAKVVTVIFVIRDH